MTFAVHSMFSDVLKCYQTAEFIAVDIPIGLAEPGERRTCDGKARRLLAGPRASSVFPSLPRCLLLQVSYEDACAHSRSLCQKGITKQAHAIYPKIAEVDRLMSPDLQQRVFEIHPELCFLALAGTAMRTRKKEPAGYEERRMVLSTMLSRQLPQRHEVRPKFGVQPDDLLDAAAAALTAHKVLRAEAHRIPNIPELDTTGLRMEMVF
jgi:predicted RNase H-like nuclease